MLWEAVQAPIDRGKWNPEMEMKPELTFATQIVETLPEGSIWYLAALASGLGVVPVAATLSVFSED